MNLKKADERDWNAWAIGVAERLCTCGYFYDPDFSSNVDSADAIVRAAHSLGPLFSLKRLR